MRISSIREPLANGGLGHAVYTRWVQVFFPSAILFMEFEFRKAFRMTRASVETLHTLLQPHISGTPSKFRLPIPSHERLCIFLYYVAQGRTLLVTANQFHYWTYRHFPPSLLHHSPPPRPLSSFWWGSSPQKGQAIQWGMQDQWLACHPKQGQAPQKLPVCGGKFS